MECLVCGQDSVSINNVNKYCWNHYQIYDMLLKLYHDTFESNKTFSWKDYLLKTLEIELPIPGWKQSLTDHEGKPLDMVASVAKAELRL
jgi:hypothetical protein